MIPHTWQVLSVRTLHVTQRNTRPSLSHGAREEGRQTFISLLVVLHLLCWSSTIQQEYILCVFLPHQLCHPCPTHSLDVKIQLRHWNSTTVLPVRSWGGLIYYNLRKFSVDQVPRLCNLPSESWFISCPSPNGSVTMSYFSKKKITHDSLTFYWSLYSILGGPRPCDPQHDRGWWNIDLQRSWSFT